MKCYEYLLRWGKEKKDDTFYEEDGFSMTWGEALRFVEGEKEALSALGVKTGFLRLLLSSLSAYRLWG
jgi:hypothetical protein